MAKWKYTLESGIALREAIEAENIEQVIYHLSQCYRELLDKLSKEDKEWKQWDIEETIEFLDGLGEEDVDADEVDWYLSEFYDLCDDIRAFVALD